MTVMKLTNRQRQFLTTLIELYRESKEPLHYSAIAERLGLTKWAAYDMLQLLEGHGLVTKVYHLARTGVGRSSVLYSPTPRAEIILAQLASRNPKDMQALSQEAWEEARDSILSNLSEPGRHGKLLEEILERLEQPSHPMLQAADLAASLLLDKLDLSFLHRLDHLFRQEWLKQLNPLMVIGLMVGLSLQERSEQAVGEILPHLFEIEKLMVRLTPQEQARLIRFYGDAIAALHPQQAPVEA